MVLGFKSRLLVIQALPSGASVLGVAEVDERVHAAGECNHVIDRPECLKPRLQNGAGEAGVQVPKPQVLAGPLLETRITLQARDERVTMYESSEYACLPMAWKKSCLTEETAAELPDESAEPSRGRRQGFAAPASASSSCQASGQNLSIAIPVP